jgi:hypothetical protein
MSTTSTSSVFTSQTGIKGKVNGSNAVDYTTDNLFAGMWRLDQTNLNRFDPFIQGYAFIMWTRLPIFFDSSYQSQFQALTEKNFKAFSGLGDMELDQESITHGFAGNELPVATNLKKGNNGFTLKHYELAGSPMRELYEYWVSGVRDIETGLAHYHGKIEDGTYQYSMKNHTGELLYVVTDPSGAISTNSPGDGIEYAAYYTNVFPTKIPQDHLNYSSGDHGIAEIDIEFKGNFHVSAAINTLAVSAMKTYAIRKKFGDYQAGATNQTFTGYNEAGSTST